MLKFLSSDFGRVIAGALGIGIVLGGTYLMGHGNGEADGITKGRKAGYESRNEEVKHLQDNVTALTKTLNDERKAQLEKIQAVQADAADAAIKTAAITAFKIRERDAIIKAYASATPIAVQQRCGLSIETVRALNQVIQNANEVNDEQTQPPPTD